MLDLHFINNQNIVIFVNKLPYKILKTFLNNLEKLSQSDNLKPVFSRRFLSFMYFKLQNIIVDKPKHICDDSEISYMIHCNLTEHLKDPFFTNNNLPYLPEILFHLIKETLPFSQRNKMFLQMMTLMILVKNHGDDAS